MKKLLTILTMAFCATVFADTATVGGITWTYTVKSDGTAIVGGDWNLAVPAATTGALTIPSSLGGHKVTVVGQGAFYGISGITSVTVSEGVTEIQYSAFAECEKLESVSLPSTVVDIHEWVFSDSPNLKKIEVASANKVFSSKNGLLLSKDGKTLIQGVNGKVTVPSGVEIINFSAFHQCTNLTSVTLPTTLKEIGHGAFGGCSRLGSVTIPNGVTYIGDSAFSECKTLASVNIPSSVTEIGSYAFQGCSTVLYDVSTVPGLKLVDGWVVDSNGYSGALDLTGRKGIVGGALYDCDGLTSVIIPGNMKTIGWGAFDNCHGLTSVTIKSGVTEIVGNFNYCDNLKSVSIPSTVRYISNSFMHCASGLYDTTTISGATMVGGWVVGISSGKTGTLNLAGATGLCGSAFQYPVPKITKLSIPKTLLYISGYFYCETLAEYAVDGANPNFSSENKALYSKDKKTLIKVPQPATSFTFASGVETIGPNAFASGNIKSVTIPSSVRIIEESAFEFCTNLTSVTIPEGVKTIGGFAFQDCSAITSVKVPSTVTKIGDYAFAWCENLKTVKLPDTLKGAISESKIFGESSSGEGPKIEYYAATSKLTVTFDANGGTADKSSVMKDKNATVGTLPGATRKGFAFKGWFTDKSGGTQITEKTKVTKNVTYYAQWAANKYTIKFDDNGGKGSAPADIKATYNKEVALGANKFTRTDYTFLGWATDKKATAATYKDKAKVKNLSAKDGAKVTLYAVWSRNAYKIVFKANGGTGSMKDLSVKSGESKTLTANAFKQTGSSFKAWNTKADGKGTSYKDKASVKLTKKDGDKVTLYAQWTANTYKIAFDSNGGRGSAPKTVTATYNKEAKLSANTFKRTDYTFLGWGTSKKATKVSYKDKAKVKNLATGGTVKLYALWKPNPYTVKFDANGGKGKMGNQTIEVSKSTALAKNKFTRTGYEFKGWAKSKGGKVVYTNAQSVKDLAKNGKSVTLYAVWEVPSTIVGTYDGYVGEGHDEDGLHTGVLKATIAASGKMTATVAMLGKTYKFSSDKFSKFSKGVYTYSMGTKDKKSSLTLVADSETKEWTVVMEDEKCRFTAPGYSSPFYAIAWKNEFGASGKVAMDSRAAAHIANLEALKTVYLKLGEGVGNVYPLVLATKETADLTMTIGKAGKVTLTGKALGVTVNATSQLVIDDADIYTCNTFVIPVVKTGQVIDICADLIPYSESGAIKLADRVWMIDADCCIFKP